MSAAAAGAIAKLSRDNDERWSELARAMHVMQRDMNALVRLHAQRPSISYRKRRKAKA